MNGSLRRGNYIRKFLLTIVMASICLSAINAQATSQRQKLFNLKAQGIPIYKVFKSIQKQTKLQVFYNNADLNDQERITVSFENTPIDEVISNLLQGKNLSWTLSNNKIVIKKADVIKNNPNAGNNSGDTIITSQIPKVSGKVTDGSGTPIARATVVIKGTSQGTTTDDNGDFVLHDVKTGSVVVVSSLGYQNREIQVVRSTIQIPMNLNVQDLDEVTVVSTGYQSLPKERSTGSFAFVNNQLLNRRVSTDVVSRLEGVVPGLLFNRNTIGGANGSNLSIRGNSTLFANNQPLIVVDGFPYDGDLSNINPNNIESISILKDAASASIWGVRSGNGVIVIETKRGRRDKPMAIGFNTNITVGDKPYIYKDPNYLNSNDFIGVEQELFTRGFYDAAISSRTNFISPVVQILSDQRDGKIDAATAASKITALQKNDVRSDISKYLYQKSVNQQYAVNVSGGGNKYDYFFSAGYDKNVSNLVGNKLERVTLTSVNNFYPVKNLNISVGLNYTNQNSQNNSPAINFTLYPYSKLADDNGNPLSVARDYSETFKDSMVLNHGFLDWHYRPLDEINNVENITKLVDNRLNLGAGYRIIPGLTLSARYQYEKQTSDNSTYNSVRSYYARNQINRFTQLNGGEKYPIPVAGILQLNNSYVTSHRLRGQIDFSHSWEDLHTITAIAGAEINEVINESNYNTTYGYNKETRSSSAVIDYINWYSLNPTGIDRIPNNLGFNKATDHFISYYSNAAYTFKHRYIFSLSGRIDRSNLFGVNTNQKSVPLYSVGLGWDLSKETFYKWTPMPYLKFRAAYGYNGNINKSATAQTTLMQSNNSYFFGQTYATIQYPGNPELRWEKVRIANFGLDFALKNQIVSGSVEFYTKKGIDLFGNAPLAPSTGVPGSTFFGNVAGIKGHGWDVVLNSINIQGSAFQWTTNLLFSQAVDKLTDYKQEIVSSINYIKGSNASSIFPVIGRPLYSMYSYMWAGLTADTGDPQGYVEGKPSTDYAAIIGNTSLDSLVYHGPARPTIFGSLRNTFTYKGVSLSFNILYKFNYYFRRTTIDYSALYQGGAGHKDFTARWQKPGDEAHTNIPSLQFPPVNADRTMFYSNSSIFVERGDHIRLQDINITYDLKYWLPRLKFVSQLQLYGYMNNIGIIWKANNAGLDPDIYTGIPNPRTYAIGLRANF